MSSGSYFTLYRKYPVKATDEAYASLKKQYLDEYKQNGMSAKKQDDEYIKDLPLVLELSYGKKESEYDEKTKQWIDVSDHSINGKREKYLSILNNERNYLDELMTWHFCSGFTCLKNEWNLDGYVGSRSQRIVSKLEAEKILQACDYLLSGKWSDDFEKILNNEWIKTLSDGNRSESYWKYVYRNDKKSLREISRDEVESAEYDITHLKNVLDAYVNADEDFDDKLILVYTAW